MRVGDSTKPGERSTTIGSFRVRSPRRPGWTDAREDTTAVTGSFRASALSFSGSTTRRQFVAGAASAGLALALPFPLAPARGHRPVAAVNGTQAAWPGRQRTPRQERQFDTVVVGGRLIDPAEAIDAPRDIGITGGRVARVAERIAESEGRQVVRAPGMIVTPGLIDIHTHVYDGVSGVSIDPDVVGIAKGVTTVIDAGSSGATTFPGFRTYVAAPARTRVHALLNVSSPGMTVSNELADLAYIDPDAIVSTVEANRDVIVGLKVRMLAGIPGGGDLEVMRLTRLAAEGAGVPVMVHIGGQTSPLPRILEMLRPGDVVTHSLRRNGSILDDSGTVYPEVLEAVERGVHLDIGHGRGNLDFDVAERALGQGIRLAAISSDVHRGNALGPVFGLPTTLTKFLHMGMSLEEVIRCATSTPAAIFDFGEELGTLREGAMADLSVFQMVEGDYELVDSGGKRRTAARRLVPYAAMRAGRPYGAITR